jgi:uncharacterized protein (DUF58 family)
VLGRFGNLTIRGWCLFAAGAGAALCAVLVGERDLLRVAAFAMMLPVLAAILVISRTRIGLQADREVVPSRTPVGGDCQVHLTLRGTGRWSGLLLLQDVVPRALGGPRRFVVAQLPQHREVQVVYPLRPVERSVHSLGPLIGRVADPLGLAQCHRTLAGSTRLVVLPAVLPLVGLPAGGEFGGTAGGGAMGAGSDPDAVVVRSYRQGDDLRRVHWRTTARRDELMVRVEEWAQRGGITVLLDHRATAHRGDGPTSSLEYAVSLAASVYVHLRQRGTRLRLVTVDGAVLAGDGAEHPTDTALDALAALCATDQRDLINVPVPAASQDVVAILGALGPAAVEQLLVHHLRAARGHAVLLDVAAWATDSDGKVAPDPAKAARLLIAAGWAVTVAGPQHPPSAVWNQLCVSSHSRLRVPR